MYICMICMSILIFTKEKLWLEINLTFTNKYIA